MERLEALFGYAISAVDGVPVEQINSEYIEKQRAERFYPTDKPVPEKAGLVALSLGEFDKIRKLADKICGIL